MEFSLKTSSIDPQNISQIYFSPKLTLFVARSRRSLRPSNSALFNRENNIVDPNVDVVQPKVFLDPLWDRWSGTGRWPTVTREHWQAAVDEGGQGGIVRHVGRQDPAGWRGEVAADLVG
jgi:hypothetical protein